MDFSARLLPAPRNGGFALEGYWVWCGSVIRGEDGRYHMFASRWPQSLPFFAGYPRASEVVRASADTPVGPYRFEEIVLPARGPQYWDGMMTHNPTIHRRGDTYLLFYIGFSYRGDPKDGGRPFCIGMATSNSVYGPWRRSDRPVLEPRPGRWDGSGVTNPAPCVLPDGRLLLVYRSNTPQGMRLGAAMADGIGAPFERISEEPVGLWEGKHCVEDPFVWWAGDHVEMLAKDWTGRTGEAGAGIHAWSEDRVTWQLMPQPKAYSRTVRWEDGTVSEQGHLERPQLLVEKGHPTHLFLATGDGPAGFEAMKRTAMTRTWNMVIPLAGEPAGRVKA